MSGSWRAWQGSRKLAARHREKEPAVPIADFSLDGKVAIVTGGSRGIGRAIAIGLAEHGADVALAARKPEALAEAVAAVEATGRRAIAVPTNVRRMDELDALVAETQRRLGRVDILVNNAGTNPVFGPVQDIDERAWDMIMNTNVKSVHFLSNRAREAMLEHGDGGSVINVSSMGGIAASAEIGGYSVSKAAVIMLTQVQAKTWGRDGIRVNCIAPGLIKTDFARALWENPAILEAAETQSALRRIGLPEEMPGAVVFLASPASSFITGQTLVLDGGRVL
jgi:NAD(P)-dependent dehydrogenase (short-subunit alcohol dehydrogenase family)